MLRLTRRIDPVPVPDATLTLTLEQRLKSRQRVTLDDGTPVGLFLERGKVLRDGEALATEDGAFCVIVQAAAEPVSTVRTADNLALARACYHLGNRHVPLQIGAGWLRYRHDHVLDALVEGLGLEPVHERARFEPEAGAYDAPAHAHAHGHGHDHDDGH